MKNKFQVKYRNTQLAKAKGKKFDLIVIGGGITGAGIALDAVSRGFSVLLLEKLDFASGTSSKSTKLIHGGLRYLKQLELGLVKESGSERAIVHKLAPHLVHPEKMFLPIVEGGSFGKWSASMAISVYDYLASVRKQDRKQSLSREEALAAEPLLDSKLLKSGIIYSEYRTDDARLCIEVIKKAVALGALAFNYCEVTDLEYDNGKVSALRAYDQIGKREYIFSARFIVSAAGPWVDHLRKKDDSLNNKRLRLTKGVHLVFDRERLPVRQSIYFDDFEGRMLFAIPRLGVTYVGTTDTDYRSDMDRILCEESDIEYILNAVNKIFDIKPLSRIDIRSTWAGVRPLIGEEGKSASEVSRKDEIFESDSGLISIAGGKLTGYRKMAQRIVDLLQTKSKALPQATCQTDTLQLTEDAFRNYDTVMDYIAELNKSFEAAGSTELQCSYLVSNYGKTSEIIMTQARDALNEFGSWDQAVLAFEIDYAILEESCYYPSDFFNRRSGLLYFDPKRLDQHFEFVLAQFQKHFAWPQDKYDQIRELELQHKKDYMINAS